LSADLPLSPEDVAEIVSILDRTPYDRIDIRSNRFSLAVMRSGAGWVQSWGEGSNAAEPSAERLVTTAQDSRESSAAAVEVEGVQIVRALLPGTFYRAPQPGAAPFVEVGSPVLPDSVVGIIETMKLMTPVHAGVSGVVDAILVENATVVDAAAALVRIKPAAT
jgi:acetyl-CoA carboxylase biotin carboxyl carrier protein